MLLFKIKIFFNTYLFIHLFIFAMTLLHFFSHFLFLITLLLFWSLDWIFTLRSLFFGPHYVARVIDLVITFFIQIRSIHRCKNIFLVTHKYILQINIYPLYLYVPVYISFLGLMLDSLQNHKMLRIII